MSFHSLTSSAALSLALISSAFAASWDDPHPAATPAPSVPTSPPRENMESATSTAPHKTFGGYYYNGIDLYSQHLDFPTRPIYSFGFTYSDETEFGDFGKTQIGELDLEFRLFKFDDFLFGSLDGWFDSHTFIFFENPNLEALPETLTQTAFDLGLTWRFVNGWSTEIRVAPGLYSDITEPDFNYPITLNFYFAFNPSLSIQLGGTFRPGWDVPIMPNVSLAWQPNDYFRSVIGVPKSSVTLFPQAIFSPFATFEWRNTTYALATDDPTFPKDLTFDDLSASAGLAICPFGTYRIVGEFGTFLQREVSADVEQHTVIDLSKESFIRVSIQGTF